MYKKIIKTIKKNKELIITGIVIVLVFIIFTKIKTENFETLVKNNKVVKTTGGASRDAKADILQIERDHKCNRAGCATRETKQKKHILL